MKYFKRILVHYLTMALREAGVRIDSDTLSEIEGMCDDLDEYIHTVVKEEATQVLAETLAAIVAEEHEQPRWYWCEVSDLHAEHKWLAVKEPTMEQPSFGLWLKAGLWAASKSTQAGPVISAAIRCPMTIQMSKAGTRVKRTNRC